MPIGEKLGKPFGLLSLICRKNKDVHGEERHHGSQHRSHHVSHSRGGFNPNPTGLPPSYVNVSASGDPRASASGNAHVQYERLTPMTAAPPPPQAALMDINGPSQVQYEPLRPSVRPPTGPLPPASTLTRSTSSSSSSNYGDRSPMAAAVALSSMATSHRLQSPPQVEPDLPPPIREASHGSSRTVKQENPVVHERMSPALNTSTGTLGPAHGMTSSVPPLQSTSSTFRSTRTNMRSPTMAAPGYDAYMGDSRSADPAAGMNGSSAMYGKQVNERGTPSYSDKSTPFSIVMEEWMSQLRTPTPDVTLLPSPYDFNGDRPTPMEKLDGFKHIQDALLPTPPPDYHDQTQSTKSSDYVLSSAGRRPLVEDIASLCRDLISQDLSDRADMKQGKSFPSPHVVNEPMPRIRDLIHAHDQEVVDQRHTATSHQDGNSTDASAESKGSNGKGRRRKMCTVDGCGNLSRSRGLCKAHGGGRRCSVEGCTRASQSGSLCITHGGGKRCTVDGCVKAAQSRGMCKAHGGGVRCRVEGCTKSSQGDGFCRTHGGGRRCGHPSGCTKWAQRNGMCMAHSEGKYGNSYRGRLHRMQQQTPRHSPVSTPR